MSVSLFYNRVQYAKGRGKSAQSVTNNHWSRVHAVPPGREYDFARPIDVDRWLKANPIDARWSPEKLDVYATAILMQDKTARPERGILFNQHTRERVRREIYSINGSPDPGIVEGIYWRTHASGRPFATPEQRKRGSGFYR